MYAVASPTVLTRTGTSTRTPASRTGLRAPSWGAASHRAVTPIRTVVEEPATSTRSTSTLTPSRVPLSPNPRSSSVTCRVASPKLPPSARPPPNARSMMPGPASCSLTFRADQSLELRAQPAKRPDKDYADCSTMEPEEASERASVTSTGSDEVVEPLSQPVAIQGTPAHGAPHSCIIILDWDDTLMPTTLLYSSNGIPIHDEAKRRHARLVERTLRAAAAVARVSIVTLSGRPWVLQSGAEHLIDLDLPALLEELQITVYYAGEFSGISDPTWTPQNFEECKCLKRHAMAQSIGDWYATGEFGDNQLNILSVGDALIEQQALQQLLCAWNQSGRLLHPPLCKTVKLAEEPSFLQLHWELDQVTRAFFSMVQCDRCFDISAEGWQALLTQLEANSCD